MLKNNNASKAFFGMLSLCMKAGRLAVGEAKSEDTVRSGGAKLIILSADASDNTKKKFSNMAEFRSVPIIFVGDCDEIGHSIGRRFAVSCCVTDDGFAKRLKSLAEDM